MKTRLTLAGVTLLLSLIAGCKKDEAGVESTVFFRLFPSDTSIQTLGSFQLDDESYIIYGTTPEDNGSSPVVIRTDLKGNIIWEKHLPRELHYCTIQPTSLGTLRIVGVPGALSTSIYVTELEDSALKPVVAYPISGVEVISGVLLPPLFVIDEITGELTVAFTGSVLTATSPAILRIDAGGVADEVRTYDTGDTLSYMVRSFFQDEGNYFISGSSYHVKTQRENVRSFCMRLNPALEKDWSTVMIKPDTSVVVKGAIPSAASPSVILYGSLSTNIPGDYQNSAISDVTGKLFTIEADENGNVAGQVEYTQYQNQAHAATMFADEKNGGYMLGATTNELYDFHVVSSSRMYLLKLDESRNEQFHSEFNGFIPYNSVTVSTSSDGGYLLSGYEHTGTWLYNMCLIKTDEHGNIVFK